MWRPLGDRYKGQPAVRVPSSTRQQLSGVALADTPRTRGQVSPHVEDAMAVALVEKDAYIGELKTINGILEEKVSGRDEAVRGGVWIVRRAGCA